MSNRKGNAKLCVLQKQLHTGEKMRGSHYRDVGKNDSTANEQSTLPVALIPMIPYF